MVEITHANPRDITATQSVEDIQKRKEEKKKLKKMEKKDKKQHKEGKEEKKDKSDRKKDKKDKKKRERDNAVVPQEPATSTTASSKKSKKSHPVETSAGMATTSTTTTSAAPTVAEPTKAVGSAQAWLQKHEITIEDPQSGAWPPCCEFSQVQVPATVQKIFGKFKQPTPIQSVCWPIALADRDVIGIAETGSGKTLGFGIPALAHIVAGGKKDKRPLCLVLAPTRELAMQIHEQFEEAGKLCQVDSICIYGGVPKDEQRHRLRKGVHVVIACPGRLLDLVQEGCCDLSRVNYVVLDEADRLLDLGFEREVRTILEQCEKQKRQTLMFSATWPTSIQKLAHEFLKSPIKVTVGSPDLTANTKITQIVEVIHNPHDKDFRLSQLLENYHKSRKNRVLVFALYKKEAARLEVMLQRKGWKCIAIHGDMSQQQRIQNFQQFRSGEVPLLIATDVAARVSSLEW